jgi:hypothetical protein
MVSIAHGESRTEIGRLAKILVQRYGERSTSYAEFQSLKALNRGEPAVGELWRLIAIGTLEILRSGPD